MKTLFFTLLIVFNVLIPEKMYALTVEQNAKILQDPKSTNELIILGSLIEISTLSSNTINENFIKIHEYALKYIKNEISLDEFKLLSSKGINECEALLDKFLNNRLLIPNSSTSKFHEVRKHYSDTQKYYDKIEILHKKQITFIENLVKYAVVLDVEKFDDTYEKYLLSTADVMDFDAEQLALSLQLTPETTLDSKIIPIVIINNRALANLTRMNLKIMDEDVKYKEVETLHLQTLDILKNAVTLRKNFFLTLKNLEKKFSNLYVQNNSIEINEFKKAVDEFFIIGQNLVYAYELNELKTVEISKFSLDNYLSLLDENQKKYKNLYSEHNKTVSSTQNLAIQLREKMVQLITLIQSF